MEDQLYANSSAGEARLERSQQVSKSLHRKHFGQLANPSASSLHHNSFARSTSSGSTVARAHHPELLVLNRLLRRFQAATPSTRPSCRSQNAGVDRNASCSGIGIGATPAELLV